MNIGARERSVMALSFIGIRARRNALSVYLKRIICQPPIHHVFGTNGQCVPTSLLLNSVYPEFSWRRLS